MTLRWKGITLAELMLTSAVMGLIAMFVIPMWGRLQQYITSSEALVVLKTTTAGDLRYLQQELECRLFFHGVSGAPFLARVDMTGLPPLLDQSRLPNAYGVGSVALAMGGAAVSNGGNMLFLLKGFAPKVVDIGDGNPVKINNSKFLLIYLTEDNTKKIGGLPRRVLTEWKSVAYIDYEDLSLIPAAKRIAVGSNLYGLGFRYAFNSGSVDPATAFYVLNLDGSLTLSPAHLLVKSEIVELSKAVTGRTLSGYRIGVCPNTDPSMQIRMVIPQFQNVRGDSPSGFEVFAGGPPESRQVLVRLVMAAEGGFPRMLAHEQSTVIVVRDTQ